MSDIAVRFLNQTAVYWASPVMDGEGRYTFDSPKEIPVRWVQKQVKFLNERGEEELSQAVVMLADDVVVNGYLYLGTEASLSDEIDPLQVSGAYMIKGYTKTPSVDGSQFVRKAYMTSGGVPR